jgi:hypothetical protein
MILHFIEAIDGKKRTGLETAMGMPWVKMADVFSRSNKPEDPGSYTVHYIIDHPDG